LINIKLAIDINRFDIEESYYIKVKKTKGIITVISQGILKDLTCSDFKNCEIVVDVDDDIYKLENYINNLFINRKVD